jgi:hypothetical protein
VSENKYIDKPLSFIDPIISELNLLKVTATPIEKDTLHNNIKALNGEKKIKKGRSKDSGKKKDFSGGIKVICSWLQWKGDQSNGLCSGEEFCRGFDSKFATLP